MFAQGYLHGLSSDSDVCDAKCYVVAMNCTALHNTADSFHVRKVHMWSNVASQGMCLQGRAQHRTDHQEKILLR